MEAMIFGAVCSPLAAQYIKNRNASEFQDEYPRAANAIKYTHYMDDYLDSVDTVEEVIQLIKEVIHIHSEGGFEIRCWISNSKEILNQVPDELRNIDCNSTTENILPTERIMGSK
ncbi:uncharacterized protein LOC123306650 [Coccinella septempunctata]|uniref:uncharacterized protein LOC123306650 n=1 Tax=Coccinella septempunctata TaxID=41139 RepID=UPI001D07F5B7|nr:uncharacterized protein LOC123306650 [Coccinella septempunctata]